MNDRATINRRDRCPVCNGVSQPLLSLPEQPVYQHPVPADAVVPEPHRVDLKWVACTECAHGWQPEFDASLLESIYRQHYYTPAPDGIAVQFRNDFRSALEKFGLVKPRQLLLEIGASGGDVLAEIRAATGARLAFAFEPDARNAALARGRGIEVREQFFGSATAGAFPHRADLVYARHVIEHVFDFKDLFAGLEAVAVPSADLVLETPSLDHHANTDAMNPFHVEHVHVFSLRSLARLAESHGWRLVHDVVTPDGNLIAAFRRVPEAGDRGARSIPEAPVLVSLQERVNSHRVRMRQLLDRRPLVFWGAGSAAVRLAILIGRAPDLWTDGNPAKVGKRFVGFDQLIVSPEVALAAGKGERGVAPLLVVASSFAREILPRVRQLGWSGEVLDLSGHTA